MKYYTTGQIAELCGVNFRTVIRWIEKGWLPSFRLPGRGDHRVAPNDLKQFLSGNSMPLPEELMKSLEQEHAKDTILVIDDDTSMSAAIGRALKRSGYKIEVANSGFEAGVALSNLSVRAITLDIKMPGLDGHQVLDLLKKNKETSEIPVMIVSACPKEEIDLLLEAGADGYVQKPFDNQHLINELENICRH